MTGIINLIKNDSDVSALIGSRVKAHYRDQKAGLPAVTVRVVGTDPSDTKNGASTLDVVNVEVISYAETYGVVEDLANKCRLAVERQSGTQGNDNIQSVAMLDQFTDYEEINNKGIHTVETNYKVRVIR